MNRKDLIDIYNLHPGAQMVYVSETRARRSPYRESPRYTHPDKDYSDNSVVTTPVMLHRMIIVQLRLVGVFFPELIAVAVFVGVGFA